ncbi:Lacal_2735 family protein [Cellulophaga baltica]|uniref:Lacal_2735 family protein n=1 Tax=Cellulophaga baltica TaxID=76594 RepID=UPI002494986C|nr:Lacal_2735 family protein [Cellulophaga baltica]
MFGLFKKKSEKDKLYETYQKLLQEAHKLSTTNRKLSDQKTYEAEEIMKKIVQLSTKME